ncbi:MAG: hypothetical protein DRI69_05890, partial [Bacteroidetes bacterium]
MHSSKTAHYLDFSLNFIADKYQGIWKLILVDFLLFFGVLGAIALYKGWNGSALKRLIVKPSGSAIHDLVMAILRVTYITEVMVYLFTFGLIKMVRPHLQGYIHFEWLSIPSVDSF